MAFFPGNPDTRAALIWVLMELVETEEQLDWLVGRALKVYAAWPGIAEPRALYCSRFKPKDGAEAYSTVYPNGIPSERPTTQISTANDTVRIVTKDPVMQKAVSELAVRKQLPARGRR
jgi:hypothetical protein